MNGSQYIVDPEGERDPRGCAYGCMIMFIAALVTLTLCLLFPSCKTLPTAVVPEVHNNYNGHDRDHSSARGDSIIIRDSIIYRWQHDTLYVDRWHTEFRDRWRHDTLTLKDSIHVQDSVPYPVYLDRPVPYKSGYTKFTSWFFWIVLIVVLALVAFRICDKVPATKPYTTAIKAFFRIGKLFKS